MHRGPILSLLKEYGTRYPGEAATVEAYTQFVRAYPDCFERHLLIGHVTASAWVLDPSGAKVLLTHHAKLDRWLQLGGHVDGNPDVPASALREAQEESGIAEIAFLSTTLFDVDIHAIPERRDVPRHLHHDARFLLQAASLDVRVSHESHDLAWVEMTELERYTAEPSMLRMRDKALRRAKA